VSIPARKRATYADLAALPEHVVGEIIAGVLYTHPRPSPRHARAASRLGMRLGRSFDEGEDGPGGWWILDEPELHLGEDIVVPDLAGWRLETMAELPDASHFETVPDWVCEVLSPSTEADDRAVKMPVYARAGTSHAWLLDPTLKTLEVFRLQGGQWVLVRTFKGDVHVQAEPFEAVALDLSALWSPPRAP
jgi:Uma2 family endonuclease